jgi:hypothetical protein
VTFSLVLDIPSSVEHYKAAHAEFSKHPTDDMLLHIARPTSEGVQIIEVWTAEEACGKWMEQCVGPVTAALAAAGLTLPQVAPTRFEAAGLIMPTAGIRF